MSFLEMLKFLEIVNFVGMVKLFGNLNFLEILNVQKHISALIKLRESSVWKLVRLKILWLRQIQTNKSFD